MDVRNLSVSNSRGPFGLWLGSPAERLTAGVPGVFFVGPKAKLLLTAGFLLASAIFLPFLLCTQAAILTRLLFFLVSFSFCRSDLNMLFPLLQLENLNIFLTT